MEPSFWSFDPVLFASVFGVVFLAELPDKTALATVVMSTRRHPVAVFAGVTGAFLVQSLVAVLCGRALHWLPEGWVRAGSGLMFLFFAWRAWTETDGEPIEGVEGWRAGGFGHAVGASFLVIFLAEWGDLSQLATAALVARRGRPWTVFVGAATALTTVTALMAALGHQLRGRFHPERVRKAAAVLFAVVGLVILARRP